MSEHGFEAFLQACGLSEPPCVTIETENSSESRSWSAAGPFAVIGSDSRADLPLDHSEVSRRHVYLQAFEGRLFGIDLGSRAGTNWSGTAGPSAWLGSGKVIGVGPFRLRVDRPEGPADEQAPEPTHARYQSAAPLPGLTLELADGIGSSIPWRMTRSLVLVGSAPGCKLRFPDSGISRHHCSLIRTPSGLWVVDLIGDGGLFVNGEYARAAQLDHGDRVQLGRASIRVRIDGAKPRGTTLSLANPQATALAQAVKQSSKAELLASFPFPAQITMPQLASLQPGDPAMAAFAEQFGMLQQQQMFEQFHSLMMAMLHAFGALHREQLGTIRDDIDRLEQITRELQTLQAKPAAPEEPAPTPTSRPAATTPVASTNPRPHPNGSAPSDAEFSDDITRRIFELQSERQGRWQRVVGFLSGVGNAAS